MDRRLLLATLVVVVAVGAVAGALTVRSPTTAPSDPDRTYPAGAGADHIHFSTLESDDADVSHTPGEHWDSYAIVYTAPPERPIVEGDYYIDSSTGRTIADRRHDATVYRNGTTYAFAQPAESIPNERQRKEFESDDAFVYDDTTETYYRYDPHYGRLAPTNVGQHTALLEAYAWKAINTTTHHGIPVITYGLTGTRTSNPRIAGASNGTLQLGADDGVIYAYDLTLDTDERTYRYTYDVRPAPFPEHEWVHTAREIAGNTTDSSAERRHQHLP
jgi:hypothetical protein